MKFKKRFLPKFLAFSALLIAFTTTARSATTPYLTDFESGIGPEWSDSTLDNTYPTTFTQFSGRHSNDPLTLTLTGLTTGVSYTLGFDFYAIDSWDGNGGPDVFIVQIDGDQKLNVTFSNYNGNPPSSPQSYPLDPDVGRFEMGFNPGFVDAIYRNIEIAFTASGSSAVISFQGQNLQDVSDESWGVDNVSVKKTSDLGPTKIRITTLPAEGSTSNEAIDSFAITAERALDPTSAGTLSNYILREAGANKTFGDGDDQLITLALSVSGTKTLSFTIPQSPLQPGKYRFESKHLIDASNAAVTDYLQSFTIADPALGKIESLSDDTLPEAVALPLTESPAASGYLTALGVGTLSALSDVDYWKFDGEAGDVFTIRLEAASSGVYPQIYIQNAAEQNIWTQGAYSDRNLLLQNITITTPGTYYIRLFSNNNTGRYKLRIELARNLQLENENNSSTSNPNTLNLTATAGSYHAKVGGSLDGDDPNGDYFRIGVLNPGNAVGLSLASPSGGSLTAVNSTLSLYADGVNDPVATVNGSTLSFTVQNDGNYSISVQSTNPGIRAQYVLSASISDGVPPKIISDTLPSDQSTTPAVIDRFTLGFSEEIIAANVNDPTNYELRSAGPDGTFGNGDDVLYTISPQNYQGGLSASYLISDGPLQAGKYRFTIKTSLGDRAGNHLAAPYILNFTASALAPFTTESRSDDTLATATVLTPVDTLHEGVRVASGRGNMASGGDQDFWSFIGKKGDQVVVASESADHSVNSGLAWQLLGADGSQLSAFSGNGNGSGQLVPFSLPSDGTYYIRPQFYYGYVGEYHFYLGLVSPPLTIETEPNDSLVQADFFPRVVTGQTASVEALGLASLYDTAGDFHFIGNLAFGSALQISLRKPTGSPFSGTIELWKDTSLFLSADPGATTLNYTLPADGSGAYYAHIIDTSGGGLFNQYFVKIGVTDSTRPLVTQINLPDEGSTNTYVNPTIGLTFSEDMLAAAVNAPATYDLRSAGLDGTFGTTDDQIYTMAPAPYLNGTSENVAVVDGPLQPGKYRFTIKTVMADANANNIASQVVRAFTVADVPGFIYENRGNDTLAGATSLSASIGTGPAGSMVSASTTTGTGAQPWGIVAADFNGDSKLDIATANFASANISVLLATADGVYAAPVTYPAGSGAISIVSADFNGDGKADLAVANYYAASVSILLGNGDGTFQDAKSASVGGSPRSLVAGDLNKDGKSDIAVINESDRTVTILLGKGDGTFQDGVSYPGTGSNPYAIDAGDLNGDGALDLIAANYNSDTVDVFIGNGNGTFKNATTLNGGSHPRTVTVADLNGDGKKDIVSISSGDNMLSVFLGHGDGTFDDRIASPSGTADVYHLAVADLNADGKLDLAIANYGQSGISTMLGHGDGTFDPAIFIRYNGSPIGIVTGDFNKDGIVDAIAAIYNANSVALFLGNHAQLLTEDPAGSGIRTGTGRGYLSGPNDVDTWSFQGKAGDNLVVASETPGSPQASGLFYDILNPSGDRISYFYPSSLGFGQSSAVTLPTDGLYYVRVSPWYQYTGDYHLRVTLASHNVQIENEPNDGVGQANTVDFSTGGGQSATLLGYLNVGDTSGDYFSVGSLAAGSSLNLSLRQPSTSHLAGVLSILNSQGSVLKQSLAGAAAFDYLVPAGGDGAYFIQIESGGPSRPEDHGPFLSFDGQNEYVDTGHWSPGQNFSIEAWVRPSGSPSGRRAIAGSLSSCQDWALVQNNGEFAMAIRPPGGCSDFIHSGVYPDVDAWYHLAATSDGTTARIYVNGKLMGSGPVAPDYQPIADSVRIGGDVCCGEYFPGSIDDVSIWNRTLSADEIAANFQKQLNGNESGLAGYWKFDENTGTLAADASGNGHDGTLSADLSWEPAGSASASGLGLLSQYILAVNVGDTLPPTVVSVGLPAEGSSTTFVSDAFTIGFSEEMDRASINDVSNYDLRASGVDGKFDTADDQLYHVTSAGYVSGLTGSFSVSDGPLQPGSYRFTVKTGIKDRTGTALASPYARQFQVTALPGFTFETRGNDTAATATPLTLTQDPAGSGLRSVSGRGNMDNPSDRDFWSFSGNAGDRVEISCETPGNVPATRVFYDFLNSDGQRLDYISPNYNGWGQTPHDRTLPLILPANGTYYVAVSPIDSYFGEYHFRVTLAAPPIALENESNGSIAEASLLTLTSQTGHLKGTLGGYINIDDGSSSGADIYFLGTLTEGTRLSVSWTKPAGSDVALQLDLINSTGTSVAQSPSGQKVVSYTIPSGAAGNYYAKISMLSGTPGIAARYFLSFDLSSLTAPAIVSDTLPAEGTAGPLLIDRFGVSFSEEMDSASLSASANYDLRSSGPNGVFDNGDDVVYGVQVLPYTAGLQASYNISGGPLLEGNYRLRITRNLRDRFGNALASVYEKHFTITKSAGLTEEDEPNDTAAQATALTLTEDPAKLKTALARGVLSSSGDIDYWSFNGKAGDLFFIVASNPNHPNASSLRFSMQKAGGPTLLNTTSDFNGYEESQPFALPSTGVYTVAVSINNDYELEYDFMVATVDPSLAVDTEYNGAVNNATVLPLAINAGKHEGSAAGYINSSPDLDYYSLGSITNGSTIFLSTRVPSGSAFAPNVSIYDASNGYVSEAGAGRPGDGVAEVRITKDGQYYAVVRGDASSGNLGSLYALDVQVVPTGSVSFPNLQVTGITPPTGTFQSGQTVSVAFVVSNVGSAATTSGSWSDRLVLSTDGILGNGDDVQLGVFPHNAVLTAGGTYTVTQSVKLPDGVTGTFYLIAQTDFSNDINEFLLEGDNTTVSATTLTVNLAPSPDLKVENLAVTGPDSSHVYTVSWKTANRGTAAVTIPFKERLLVKNTFSGVVLANTERNVSSAIAIGATIPETATITATDPGTYQVVVTTDSSDVVFENDPAGHSDAEQNSSETSFSILAKFTVTLSANPADGGAVTGAGTFTQGTQVTVSATAKNSPLPYQFANWTENGLIRSTATPYTFPITNDIQLVANFSLPSFTVTAANNPAAAGTISGVGSYSYGSAATLVATPNFGYRFDHWSEAGVTIGTDPALSLNVTKARSVVANYSEANLTHSVTVTTSPQGLGAVAGAGVYNNGQSTSISATPSVTQSETVYSFKRFTLNGAPYGTTASFPKTFSTTDPTTMAFVAEYDSRSQFPLVTNVSPSFNNPVPQTANFVLSIQFNRGMKSSVLPVVKLVNGASGAVQPIVPSAGTWTTTISPNDTYRTPAILISAGMDGTNQVIVSGAQDTGGATMKTAAVYEVVVDATAPKISGVAAAPSSSSVVVTWTTDEPASSAVEYGGTSAYGRKTPLNTSFVTSHRIVVSGLDPQTPYHYRAVSRDQAGNQSQSSDGAFTTLPAPDLKITGLTITPSTPTSGSTVALSWTNFNAGVGPSGGSWFDQIIVSNKTTSKVLVQDYVFYDAARLGNIAAGNSKTAQYSFDLPDGPDGAGALVVYLTTDFYNNVTESPVPSAESNNTFSSTFNSTLKAYPDLQVQNLAISPGSLQSGAASIISWRDANTGSAAVQGVIIDHLIVRNTGNGDRILDTTLVYDTTADGNGPIAASQNLPREFAFRFPDGARGAGSFSIELTTDVQNAIFENNTANTGESNNTGTLAISSALSAYPDLVATSINAPATAIAGQSIQISWVVQNNGAKAPAGTWTEQIFLSDDASTGTDQFVASFDYSDAIPPGQSVTHTQNITLPQFGTGNRWIVIRLDAGDAIFESDEANNVTIDDRPINLPANLIFSLSRDSVPENSGNASVYGTITRNSGTENDLFVNLSSSAAATATVPASVTIPAQQTSVSFPIGIVDNNQADGNHAVTLKATAAGFGDVTTTLNIADDDSDILTVEVSPGTIMENGGPNAATGKVTRNTSTSTALTVTLDSGDPTKLKVPTSVIIPAGQTFATFPVSAIDNSTPNRPASITISASAKDYQSAPAVVQFVDDDLPTLGITLDKSIISEGAVNPATFGTVTRHPVGARDLVVILQSSDETAARVPASVTIPANKDSATFPINAVDDDLVDQAQETQILAFSADSMFNTPIDAGSAMALLSVTDDDGPTLQVSLDADVISERTTTTGHVSRNTETTKALVVTLTSEDASEATVPASVTIPIGSRTASFTITGVVDGIPDGIQKAGIVASAANFTPGRATINVSDTDLPDLRVSAISVPAQGLTGGALTVAWTVRNDGIAAATGGWIDRVYLASTPDGANQQFIGQFIHTGDLPVGGHYDRTANLLLPNTPGNYYLVVVADSDQTVAEGSEINNTTISTQGISIAPAYRATVSTEVTKAPAGTPIPMTGRAIATGSGEPAPFVHVTVRINMKGVRRTLDVLTDASGNFSTVFVPLPSEAGQATIGADHPGVQEDPVQDSFTLYGVRFVDYQLDLRMFPLSTLSGELQIQNLGDTPLTGLALITEGLPSDVTITYSAPDHLAESETATVGYTITVGNVTIEELVKARLKVATTEGAIGYEALNLTVAPYRPTIAADPGVLALGMVRGEQRMVEFTISNIGGAATGPLQVQIPSIPWLALASPDSLPSLAPGDKARIVLKLNPASDLPLSLYNGSVFLTAPASGATLNVPFSFRAISDAVGDLKVTVTDDYTYHVAGAPNVAGATVTLTDPLTGDQVASGVTDSSGVVTLSNVAENTWQLTVTAPLHSTYRNPVAIVPGTTKELTTFIDRETVSYQWNVVPTEVNDTYKIVLESVFETEVPIPVVTIDNPFIMPLVVQGMDTQFSINISNHGLIAAERVSVDIPENPDFEFQPLIDVIDVLPAKSSMSIPVIVRAKPTAQFASFARGRKSRQGGTTFTGCQVYPKLQVKWSFVCGPDRRWHAADASLALVSVDDSCWDKLKDTVGGLSPGDLASGEWHGAACDIASTLASCVDECLGSIVKAGCGILTEDIGGAISGALGFGQCFCPPLPSLPPVYVQSGPLEVATSAVGGPGGPGGAPESPWVASVFWNYSPNCSPGATVSGGNSLGRQGETQAGGVCAQVRLRIEQEAVITRAAFLGTLEIDNGHDDIDLSKVQVSIDIRDLDQKSANDRFTIKNPELSGLTAIDGTGVIAKSSTGSAKYTFIPNRLAAPDAPTVYRIGGTLSYQDGDDFVQVSLVPSTITVYPDPNLQLLYFQQRDVYGDDPFTDVVEPSEPFDLGLMVKNTGKGVSINFKITSAQPKIVENEKGLLIDFKIIGTQVGDEQVSPTLTANLGSIDPGMSKVALWKLVSTLQGKFLDYTATFEHENALGDTQSSLIDSVEIHELIHAVKTDKPGDDTLPDFLVNDVKDADNLPDTLYLSDGTIAPVNLAKNGAAGGTPGVGNLQVTVTADMTTGWNYLQMPDPGPNLRLYRVVRSDQKEIRVPDNAWTTDRSFPSALAGAIRENLFHLLDFNGTGSYTLYYHIDDSVAPTISDVVDVAPVVQSGPISSVDVVLSEEIDLTTFTADDITLTHNGGPNLITGAVTVTSLGNNSYRIGGLSGLTSDQGNYELTVNGAGIDDYGGNPTVGSASTQWAVAGTSPVLASIQTVPSLRNTPLTSLGVVFSKPIDLSTFDFNDLSLTLDGGPNLISPGVTVTADTASGSYIVNGLGSLTADSGHYLFTVDASGIKDGAGNNGIGLLTSKWTQDTAGPAIASLDQVVDSPRSIVVPSLLVQFSEPIDPSTFDYNDITLTRNGGANLVTKQVTVDKVDPSTFRISNFSWVSGLEGSYILTVNAAGVRDLAGNSGLGTATTAWVMDITIPAPATSLTVAPDLGASSTDGITSQGQVTISGHLSEQNLSVRLFDMTANNDLGQAVVTGLNFSKPIVLAVGPHHIRVRVADVAANLADDRYVDVTIDLAPPTATIIPVDPNPRDAAVTAIDVTFSEQINPQTFTRNALELTRDGGPNLINNSVSIALVSGTSYRINGLQSITDGGGLYALTLKMTNIQDIAGNPGSDSLVEIWRRTGPNTAPILSAIGNRIIAAETVLSITNIATDADIPADKLSFSLKPGAPAGAAINQTNGVFTWKPTRAQAGQTYTVSVVVTDNGVPPLSDTKSFTIDVADSAELNVGQGIVLSGERSSLPIEFFASAPVMSMTFVLEIPTGHVTDLTADALVSEVGSVSIQALNATQYRVDVTAKQGASFEAREQILEIGFLALAGTPSAFVPVRPENLSVTKSDGTSIDTLFTRNGRIVAIVNEPLLEGIPSAGFPGRIVLYGQPSSSHQLNYSPVLGAGAVWNKETRVTLLGTSQAVDLTPNGNRVRFYQAVKLP